MAFTDGGDIGQAKRTGTGPRDHDAFDLTQAGKLAWNSDQIHLAIAFNISRALIVTIALDRMDEFVHADSQDRQPRQIGTNFDFTREAADRIHFHDTGDAAQLRLDDPILQ